MKVESKLALGERVRRSARESQRAHQVPGHGQSHRSLGSAACDWRPFEVLAVSSCATRSRIELCSPAVRLPGNGPPIVGQPGRLDVADAAAELGEAQRPLTEPVQHVIVDRDAAGPGARGFLGEIPRRGTFPGRPAVAARPGARDSSARNVPGSTAWHQAPLTARERRSRRPGPQTFLREQREASSTPWAPLYVRDRSSASKDAADRPRPRPNLRDRSSWSEAWAARAPAAQHSPASNHVDLEATRRERDKSSAICPTCRVTLRGLQNPDPGGRCASAPCPSRRRRAE